MCFRSRRDRSIPRCSACCCKAGSKANGAGPTRTVGRATTASRPMEKSASSVNWSSTNGSRVRLRAFCNRLDMRLRTFWRRVKNLRRRDDVADELNEEMRLHVELRARRLREQGVAEPEAGYMAQRQFGNRASILDSAADAWDGQRG